MQYKRVISFGDSFTWGSELSDCDEMNSSIPSEVVLNSYSRKTWPALIAQHLGVDYVCKAFPGFGNASILRQVLSTEILPTDLVIVNWTWINRWDFFDNNSCTIRQGWTTLSPGTTNHKFFDMYYKNFQSELWDKYETLKNMHVAFNVLHNNIISTSVDSLTVDRQWHCPLYVSNLMDQVETKLTWFNNKGFYNWALDNNFSIAKNGHPLEEAHQAAFE